MGQLRGSEMESEGHHLASGGIDPVVPDRGDPSHGNRVSVDLGRAFYGAFVRSGWSRDVYLMPRKDSGPVVDEIYD